MYDTPFIHKLNMDLCPVAMNHVLDEVAVLPFLSNTGYLFIRLDQSFPTRSACTPDCANSTRLEHRAVVSDGSTSWYKLGLSRGSTTVIPILW